MDPAALLLAALDTLETALAEPDEAGRDLVVPGALIGCSIAAAQADRPELSHFFEGLAAGWDEAAPE